jgi:hypothetical protein
MASVWRHERDIDLACQEEGQATKLGSDILSALGCDADEFLANVQNGKYRMTHTTTTKRQGTFREFVERCVSVDKVAN